MRPDLSRDASLDTSPDGDPAAGNASKSDTAVTAPSGQAPVWGTGQEPAPFVPETADWVRILLRGVPMACVTFGGLVLLVLLRLMERPVFGARRPITPWITQAVCRFDCWMLGLRVSVDGASMQGEGVIVANHASWLDILVLNSCQNIYFVSKSEVASWPGIGWLARATGTMFLERKRSKAAEHTALFETRLHHGHRLLFFPEGTSSDSLQVLPFKTTLFQAFFSEGLRDGLQLQTQTLSYCAPKGKDQRFYGWFGDMEFGENFLQVLAATPQGHAIITRNTPVAVKDFAGRKDLAAFAETQCRAGLKNGD